MNNSHYVSIKQSMVSITYVLHKSKQPSECLNVLCCASQSGHMQYIDPPVVGVTFPKIVRTVRFVLLDFITDQHQHLYRGVLGCYIVSVQTFVRIS